MPHDRFVFPCDPFHIILETESKLAKKHPVTPDLGKPSPAVQRRFAKQLSSLAAMAGFVEEFTSSTGLGFDVALRLQLIIEELTTNMMKYSIGSGTEFEIRLAAGEGEVRIDLLEPDVEEFNPILNAPDLDSTTLADRRAGGMGLFMVRQLADISYRYANKTGMTTLKMKIGEPDV